MSWCVDDGYIRREEQGKRREACYHTHGFCERLGGEHPEARGCRARHASSILVI